MILPTCTAAVLVVCGQAVLHVLTCWCLQVPSLRKQAEEEIQRFRHTPKPIRACQYILEHSSNLGAKFQACKAHLWLFDGPADMCLAYQDSPVRHFNACLTGGWDAEGRSCSGMDIHSQSGAPASALISALLHTQVS